VTVDELALVAGLDGAGCSGADASSKVSSTSRGDVVSGPLFSVIADREAPVAEKGETTAWSMAHLAPASLPGEAAPLLRCGGLYLPTPEADDLTDRRSAPLLSESEDVE
jgi:hypothetical protein